MNKLIVISAVICTGVLFLVHPFKKEEVFKPQPAVVVQETPKVQEPVYVVEEAQHIDSGGAKGYHGYVNPKPHYAGNPNNQFDNYDRRSGVRTKEVEQ